MPQDIEFTIGSACAENSLLMLDSIWCESLRDVSVVAQTGSEGLHLSAFMNQIQNL